MSRFFEKRNVSSAKILPVMLFRNADYLHKSEKKEILIQTLVERQNYFFSIQMFGHLKQLFVHDFEVFE